MKAPEVKRSSLVLLSGIAWSAVGIVLVVMATEWLVAVHHHIAILTVLAVASGFIIHRFGFSRIVAVNIARIKALAPGKERFSLFAFQNKRSYAIIGIMVPMGYALRHSPIPKIYLVPVYAAIGLGLLLSSFRYYQGLN